MFKELEHHEHAGHLAHGHQKHGEGDAAHGEDAGHGEHGNQLAALLVSFLAASLAITEQGAKHAEIRVQENSVFAADTWGQYQAKSTRGTLVKDIGSIIAVMGPADPEVMAKRKEAMDHIKEEAKRFEDDPKDGKKAIAERARAYEEERDHSLEQTHAYHNGAAATELAIVLTTASAITKSRKLIYAALALGVAGVVLAVLGYAAPEYGAF